MLELCRDRFGKDPSVTFIARMPDRLEVQCHTSDGSTFCWALSRGDLAMLRGLLDNMGQWERASIHAGLLPTPDLALDRPAGMDPHFWHKPPSNPEKT
jgi:hypothetical protein